MCIIKRAARLTPGATARCCAVGSARGLGPRGRRFESCHLDHVGAKSALLRRLFLPAAQKAAGCVAPLLLLPAKSHAAPSLFACKRAHNASACYQLFADKGKGIVFYFCRAEAFTGELRFCEAKVEFLKLPSNFSGESPERSAGDLPSPAKHHAAPSLFAYKCAHNAAACYQLFAEKGKNLSLASAFQPALFIDIVFINPTQKSADTAKCLPVFSFSLFTLPFSLHCPGQ